MANEFKVKNGILLQDNPTLGTSTDFLARNPTTGVVERAAVSPTVIGSVINSSDPKTTPVDTDMVGLMDSESSPVVNVLKKLSWANIKATLRTSFDSLYSLNSITREPTGFESGVVVTYSTTGKTFTLTGTVVAYYRGARVTALTSGWVSDPHSATTGVNYYLSYDGVTFNWTTIFPGMDMLLIGVAYARATNPFGVRECHGFQQWQSHLNDHYNIGTYRTSGGAITNIVPASTTADNRRPIISDCYIQDEDLLTINATLTSKRYTQRFMSGASTINYTLQALDIVPLLANNPYYNSFNTPNFGQTLMPNNSVMTVWLYEVPVTADSQSQEFRHVFVQGQSITQATSGSAANLIIARNTEKLKTVAELNLGESSIVSSEYVCIHKFVIQYNSNNWTITDSISVTGSRYSQTSAPSGNYLSQVTTDASLHGNGSVLNPLGVTHIPYPVTAVTYNGASQVLTKIEDIGNTYTLEKRFRYYAGGSNQDGSIDIMEVFNSLTLHWIRVTYNYTAGLLTSTTHTTITAWTI